MGLGEAGECNREADWYKEHLEIWELIEKFCRDFGSGL